ncbi:hypothetical protein LTR56_007735 [Elasticomyces elasticus]|nr:hypothetical protein LTR56_007735 [Elasticomyces elasticus]KAK3661893.1 hypothetical protein LTR22_007267 [Elasticomyces elasticus]KAK4925594.1 hypothetical protein LTR49_007432 [Elasticomyces elasticus]KAK5759872.1 hypothetical protein LTS12_010059 [Elasticomyces elasticus]
MASHHIAIQSEADVIITYHNQQGSITHTLFVSSSILRHGSPYFDNVLGRSIQLGAVKPIGLSLKGDDPQAMAMMFRVLHYQFAAEPGNLTPIELRAMAVVADNCRTYSSLRTTSAMPTSSGILGRNSFSGAKVRSSTFPGPNSAHALVSSPKKLHDIAVTYADFPIEYLNQTKQNIMRDIHRFIEDDIALRSTLCGHEEDRAFGEDDDKEEDQSSQCPRSAVLVTVLLRRLSNVKIWPISTWMYKPKNVGSVRVRKAKPMSVSSVLEGMQSLYFRPIDFEDFKRIGFEGPLKKCGSDHCCPDDPGHAIKKEYAREATRVAESVPRACYHCVRPGSGYECIAKGEGEAAAGSNAETG